MNVLITDDHSIVRKGLVNLILEEYPKASVSEAQNASEAISFLRGSSSWDLILLDISMPGKNGIELLKQIRTEGITTPVLMLSMHPEDVYAIRVLRAGANGFLNKDSAPEELVIAIRKVLSGKKYISEAVADKLADLSQPSHSSASLHESLSDREMQVFVLLSKGTAVTDIAETLCLSINTISTYRSRVLEKLKLKNNAELARYAIENDLS